LKEFFYLIDEYQRLQEKDNYKIALLCSTIANGYSSNHIKPEDFLPKENKQQTPEEQLQILSQFVH